jgi:hypothetical protein
MKTFVVDDVSAQTPIGEFLQSVENGGIEIRKPSGALIATVIVPSAESDEDALYDEIFRVVEQDRELIERRSKTPLSQCLTTAEVFERLQHLDAPE